MNIEALQVRFKHTLDKRYIRGDRGEEVKGRRAGEEVKGRRAGEEVKGRRAGERK